MRRHLPRLARRRHRTDAAGQTTRHRSTDPRCLWRPTRHTDTVHCNERTFCAWVMWRRCWVITGCTAVEQWFRAQRSLCLIEEVCDVMRWVGVPYLLTSAWRQGKAAGSAWSVDLSGSECVCVCVSDTCIAVMVRAGRVCVNSTHCSTSGCISCEVCVFSQTLYAPHSLAPAHALINHKD